MFFVFTMLIKMNWGYNRQVPKLGYIFYTERGVCEFGSVGIFPPPIFQYKNPPRLPASL